MSYYIIIETDDGFSIALVNEGQTAESIAKQHGALLIDEGPYPTFDAAQDVLLTLPIATKRESE